MQAICKEGGLGAVTWVDYGLKSVNKEKTDGGVRGEKIRKKKREAMTEEDQGDGEEKKRMKTREPTYEELFLRIKHLEKEVKILKGRDRKKKQCKRKKKKLLLT